MVWQSFADHHRLLGHRSVLSPFLYAAVVVELIALLSVPLLSPRGSPTGSGIIHYLSAQTIALPLILLSGWMVSGIETSPSAEALVLRGALLLMLGFVLWLGSSRSTAGFRCLLKNPIPGLAPFTYHHAVEPYFLLAQGFQSIRLVAQSARTRPLSQMDWRALHHVRWGHCGFPEQAQAYSGILLLSRNRIHTPLNCFPCHRWAGDPQNDLTTPPRTRLLGFGIFSHQLGTSAGKQGIGF